jgi:hypothetical protein
MLLVVKSGNSDPTPLVFHVWDRPPIGFCNEPLIGSKYAGQEFLKVWFYKKKWLSFAV